MTPYVIIEHQKTMIEGRNLACYVPLLVTIMTSQEISVKGRFSDVIINIFFICQLCEHLEK